ncbi:choice-of-anchor I family protein [Phycicoccus sp. MAQZ13P-2]|uniref:choice-of-anchor I family protein n=1 Tax=Phycicoccus mangrovi TaxID=2840470 RepID=UPI001BFFFBE0|nr:choice-of-anchor I family protein [Phycicoccus mangrovi]MBT9256408.1 choice-of-anchor I family protein [Phycicoccus mangrovi]MBT9275946.1 choice-of-anchor I family protein [Phycicoccus mangrovi]
MRLRPALAASALSVAVAALVAGGGASVAGPVPEGAGHARGHGHQPRPTVGLTPVGTYRTGSFDAGGSEITAYDARTRRLFVVNSGAGTVDVLDISRPEAPRKVAALDTPGVNSVAVHRGLVAVAQQADPKTAPGSVRFFDARTARPVGGVTVGSLPDMVTFTPDGTQVLVANEGEPEGYCAGQVDPEGSVSVVDLRRGPGRATVRTADFRFWDGREAALRASGVRIYGPNASASQDIEPEYVTTDGRTAWVTLQENNAVATVDLRTARVTRISALGTKDHSVAGNGLDASDRDGGIAVRTWPVRGLYEPDAVAHLSSRGRDYLVTANEGDARDYDCFAEEVRVKDLTLDPTVFPDAAALRQDAALGRLTVSSTSPAGPAGVTELQALGGRSVSVRDARTGALVWDSGDAFEQLVAARQPALFNANNDDNDSFDSRSDNKGPEPEGLDLGALRGRTYAFVGLERSSGIVVVDVTDPTAGRVAGYASNRSEDPAADATTGAAGDLGPEGILFVPAGDSPTHRPLLVVGNEVSGTTTIWSVATR